MEQYKWETVAAATLPPVEAMKVIRKLRWVVLKPETQRQQQISRPHRVPAGVLADIPYETD